MADGDSRYQGNLTSMGAMLGRLWLQISLTRRRQLAFVFVLMLLATFAELVSIGAVMPFLAVLTSPERVFELPVFKPIEIFFGISSPEQLLLPLTIMFALAALAAGGLRLLLLWASTRLSYATGSDLSASIYEKTLYQPYSVHIARNSSEIIDGMVMKANVLTHTLTLLLNIATSLVILSVMMVALFSVDPVVALSCVGGFGAIYGLIIRLTRKRILKGSQMVARDSTKVIKSLQEGLGGIRDVLLEGNQKTYCDLYRSVDLPLRRAQGFNLFVAQSARFGMEALGMCLIASFSFLLAQQPNGIANAIPVLGTLALGAQRMLPMMQQAYASWTHIQGDRASIQDALGLLEQPMSEFALQSESVTPIPFKKNIQLVGLGFRYNNDLDDVLYDVNLVIERGSKIGIIGETGSGKSTFLDVLMGLLTPTTGRLLIDDVVLTGANLRSWQSHIAHVPQTIFLSDATVAENIAFGVPREKIDHKRVAFAAHQAQIAASITQMPDGYQTLVGERGVRLSGGQRQRIGIARALYKRADVIVFDEATSALDNDTEIAVMESVSRLDQDLTILMIAHRMTTLKNCDLIIEIKAGRIDAVGSYQELIAPRL